MKLFLITLLPMIHLTAIRAERGGEEEEVEGSTSTNNCDDDVIDTIEHVVNNYDIADAVVVD